MCIFSPTIDIVASWPPLVRGGERDAKLRWNLLTMKWNNMFTQRRRAGKWAYTRVAVLTAPAFVITCVLLPAGLTDLAELLWTVYDFAAIFLFLVVAARLVSIRGLVTLEELVESRMLMLFSAAAVQYFVVDNMYAPRRWPPCMNTSLVADAEFAFAQLVVWNHQASLTHGPAPHDVLLAV